MFNITHNAVNKLRNWVALTLVGPNGAYMGVALIDLLMKDISNIKVHLKTCSGNVNIVS